MSDILQPIALPAWIVSLPLVAAGLSVVLPKIGRRAAFVTTVAISVLVARLGKDVLRQGTVRMQVGGWPPPLGIELVADGLSVVMLAVAALVIGAATLYAAGYLKADRASRYFWPLWLFLWSALNSLFLAGDIFNLYVTLELLGLSAVSLVALSRSSEALPAAMRYLLVSLTGSLSYLMGVSLLYAANGTLNLDLLAAAPPESPALVTAFALMAAGLIMKSALFPLHWTI